MKPRALSMGAVLEDWVAEFAKYGHAKVSSSETITIEFVLPTLDQAYVSHEDVAALREALELLHLAALVDVDSVQEAIEGLCYHSFTEPEDEDEDGFEVTKHSLNDVPTIGKTVRPEVEFVLTFYGTAGRFLEEKVAPSLFAVKGPRSSAFLSAWSTLLEGTAVSMQPMTCRINIVSMDGGLDDHVEEDYVERVMSFIQQLDQNQLGGDANQDDMADGIPIRIESINLELNEMAINKSSAAAVAILKNTKIPVVCSRVGINPHTLTCSAEELSTFLDAIGTHSSKLTVEIGHVMMSEPPQCLDDQGTSQEQLICTLFRGIGGSQYVTGLSFGPLLAMMSTPTNREYLWRELFACLADPSIVAPISTLVLSPQIELMDEYAAFIQDAVASASPKQIKSLIMWLTESSAESVQALIRAVGSNVTAMTLHTEAHARTPSQTVEVLVHTCSELQRLTLTAADIDSMDIFSSDTTILRELTLNAVVVEDSSSINTFLTKLADTTTPLAKKLHKFHVKTENNGPDHLAIDHEQASLIAQLLESNKVIREVEFSMREDISTSLLTSIQSHNHEVLAEPLQLTQKLAFLSATQERTSDKACCVHRNRVDEDVVRLIFEFAAERVSRHVYLDF